MNDFTSRTGAAAPLAAPTQRPNVQQAIAGAAERSVVEFDYLLAQAQVESSLNPRAKARTSSATGLYQFIESTWLSTVKKHGPRFGLEGVSAQISTARSGKAYVADPAQRSAILALRNDPQIASFMAAGLAEDNRERLLPVLGREPDHSELYLAHFLGAGGASRFLTALQRDPDQSAAGLFPRPASANRPVFYERGGGARSLNEVMDYVRGRMERALGAVPAEMRSASPQAPYLIADENAFGPMSPPAITYTQRAAFRGFGAPAPLAPPQVAVPPQSLPAMSQVLKSTFDAVATAPSEQSTQQIRRAYDQLKAFGL